MKRIAEGSQRSQFSQELLFAKSESQNIRIYDDNKTRQSNMERE